MSAESQEAPDKIVSRSARREPQETGVTKVSFNLPTPLVEDLRRIAREQGVTVTQLLRNAIALQLYVNEEIEDGATLLFEKPGGRMREVVLR